jgi:hypothetical protein
MDIFNTTPTTNSRSINCSINSAITNNDSINGSSSCILDNGSSNYNFSSSSGLDFDQTINDWSTTLRGQHINT